MSRFLYFIPLCILCLFCGAKSAHAQQFTLLLPDQPTREQGGPSAPLDVLFALTDPFALAGEDSDMPQMLAVLRILPLGNGPRSSNDKTTTEREDLLGAVEEIRYADKKAWAVHAALDKPGLYTLIAETHTRWDADGDRFTQHFVKTLLPVKGQERGWDTSAQLRFEIVPTTRPFGLMAPALFSGKVLLDTAPLAACTVRIARLNTEKRALPSAWHAVQVVKTDDTGAFAFVCPVPGWWVFMAVAQGDTLKGPDGQNKPLELGALTWVYVDDGKVGAYKPPVRPHKK